jgi:hypothetical protein
MGHRSTRNRRPSVEPVEARELLSLVTAMMAAKQQALYNAKARAAMAHVNLISTPPPVAMTSTVATTGSGTRSAPNSFTPTTNSIAVPSNQGFDTPAYPGYNLILQPTGTATKAEVKRQLFKAVYQGTYVIAPGSFSSQTLQVFIRGAGTASSMLHSDIQMRLAVASDPSLATTGASVIFDRNLNSNSALGFDLATPRTNVDSRGRPNLITSVTLDVNSSSGVYVEGFAQGQIQIRYFPSKNKLPGTIEQGTAVVKIIGQIYAPNVAFILRNADINP